MSELEVERAAPTIIEHAGLPIPGVPLDVERLNEALPHLRRPFTPAALRWKVQSVWPSKEGCVVVAYIDARLVIERLNAVCGGAWSAAYRPAQDSKLMLCDLTVFGVTRTDVGGSPKGPSKDLVSDALKRAAVQFGIGVSVYALPQKMLTLRDESTKQYPAIKSKGEGDKKTLVLTDAGHWALGKGYEQWLTATGVRLFGTPMDHGDVPREEGDAVGVNDPDAEVERDAAAEVPVQAQLTDERAVALIEQARVTYAHITEKKGGRKTMPPGAFSGMLQGAWHSHDALVELNEHLDEVNAGLAETGGAS